MLFYDEFSGLIYQGRIVRVQSNKALVETPKKTFKVSLSNVKLLQQDRSLVKSEFFSRDDSDPSLRASRPVLPGPPHFQFFNPLQPPDKAFSVPKISDSQNLSSFLRTTKPPFAANKDPQSDFSMPLFPQNVSGGLESVKLAPRSEKSLGKSDFSLLGGLNSANANSSKFQSVIGTSLMKDFPPAQLNSSQNSSAGLNKPFKPVVTPGLSQSQPLVKLPLGNSLFTLAPQPKSVLESQVGAVTGQTKSSVIDNDLVNFAILFKLLQKKKKLAEMHDRLVRNRSETNLDANTEDLRWVKESVTHIDQTLKNVWLSLKLREKTIKSRPYQRRRSSRTTTKS